MWAVNFVTLFATSRFTNKESLCLTEEPFEIDVVGLSLNIQASFFYSKQSKMSEKRVWKKPRPAPEPTNPVHVVSPPRKVRDSEGFHHVRLFRPCVNPQARQDEIILFHRPDVLALTNKVCQLTAGSLGLTDEEVENNAPTKFMSLVIEGIPGCGKTSAVWQEFLQFSTDNPHVIVKWVSVAICHMITIENGQYKKTAYLNLGAMLSDLGGAGLIVFDGVNLNNWKDLKPLCVTTALRKETYQVIIGSMQADITSADHSMLKADRFHLPGWSLEECLAASDSSEFFSSIVVELGGDASKAYTEEERHAMITKKFTVAGRSARWMFDLPLNEAVADITFALSKCNVDDMFNEAYGMRHVAAINSLFEYLNGLLIFTSDYIARKVMTKCDGRILAHAYSFNRCKKNPAFEGWLLEFDFFVALMKKIDGFDSRVFRLLPDTAEMSHSHDNTFTSSGYYEFEQNIVIQPLHDYLHGWFVPTMFNQGGFDFSTLLHDQPRGFFLRYVQVSMNVNHELKMWYMYEFARQYNAQAAPEKRVKHIEIVLLVPYERAPSFSRWHLIGEITPESAASNTRKNLSASEEPEEFFAVTKFVAGWMRIGERAPSSQVN